MCSIIDWASEWETFYLEVFGLKAELSEVNIPENPGGFDWVIFVAHGLTLNRAWAVCQDRFPAYSLYGDNLSSLSSLGMKCPDNLTGKSYARRFRNRIEADEENKNLSACTLEERGSQEITLLERFLLELWYHWKTEGGHLDLLKETLCAGSRYEYGRAPVVSWSDHKFVVRVSGFPDESVRSRSAI